MSNLSKLSYRVNAVPISISAGSFFFFLLTNWQADLKIYMEMKKTENGQNNVEKKRGFVIRTFEI